MEMVFTNLKLYYSYMFNFALYLNPSTIAVESPLALNHHTDCLEIMSNSLIIARIKRSDAFLIRDLRVLPILRSLLASTAETRLTLQATALRSSLKMKSVKNIA